jgi:translation elongation factor EF-Tu-like GTPase
MEQLSLPVMGKVAVAQLEHMPRMQCLVMVVVTEHISAVEILGMVVVVARVRLSMVMPELILVVKVEQVEPVAMQRQQHFSVERSTSVVAVVAVELQAQTHPRLMA